MRADVVGHHRQVKRVILFDHDGVLVDTEPCYYEAGRRALATIGVPLDQDQYLADMTTSGGTWARARAAGVEDAVIDGLRELRDSYYQHYQRTEAIEIPGVMDVLAELADRVRMAIVTTSKRVDFELIHAERRICDHMEVVLVREDYVHAKPHPEPYLTALERLGATPREALVVEDSARGLRSAVAAGIDCAVVHNAFTASHDFSQARYRIRTLAELPDLLASA